MSRPLPLTRLITVTWEGIEWGQIRVPKQLLQPVFAPPGRLSESVSRWLYLNLMPAVARVVDWRIKGHPHLRFRFALTTTVRFEIYYDLSVAGREGAA